MGEKKITAVLASVGDRGWLREGRREVYGGVECFVSGGYTGVYTAQTYGLRM